ncbi:hypothetical protein SLEP1_g57347 [Rubroshorea leprosula]|uniref:Uncharacterized protein n=1 Tax=Rubroshorea leprosula TaxID=152421 RepID=A0AAV5MKY4_9ROSI|nr:hypothetical protein SLEP1_g57347 [Rubroshorea leprosula]
MIIPKKLTDQMQVRAKKQLNEKSETDLKLEIQFNLTRHSSLAKEGLKTNTEDQIAMATVSAPYSHPERMMTGGEDDDWRRRGRSVLSMEEGGERRRAEIGEVIVESPTAGIGEAVG